MVLETLASLQRKIEILLQEAEQIRDAEVAEVVKQIKEAIEAYGIDPEDLFPVSVVEGRRLDRRSSRSNREVKYADGFGGEWVGRGPRPLWLRDAVSKGHNLEDFLVR